jgi:hypothetical protein
MAVTHAQAERQALTADAETQADWLEIVMPICAVPLSRPRRDRAFAHGGCPFIGTV